MASWHDLPQELHIDICLRLPVADFMSLTIACVNYDYADEYNWKSFLLRDHGLIAAPFGYSSYELYKQISILLSLKYNPANEPFDTIVSAAVAALANNRSHQKFTRIVKFYNRHGYYIPTHLLYDRDEKHRQLINTAIANAGFITELLPIELPYAAMTVAGSNLEYLWRNYVIIDHSLKILINVKNVVSCKHANREPKLMYWRNAERKFKKNHAECYYIGIENRTRRLKLKLI